MTRTEDPVQRQLDAYNAHDLERFLAEYTDDVRVYRRPFAEPSDFSYAYTYSVTEFRRDNGRVHASR